jgi:hypothetical protein
VPLFEPVVGRLRAEGHEVVLTARDHAQTVPLARRVWPELLVVGGQSPSGRIAKGRAVVARARGLAELAHRLRPDVALSHGSYAQILAARAARVPAVTMMDYEYQPANHLSFRLARRVIVPEVFPESALRRFGARSRAVVRYRGFKEELYLAGFTPNPACLDELELERERVLVVLRPPPEGALYHRGANARFDELVALARQRADVCCVLLPRTREQASRYGGDGVVVPPRPVDGRSLLAAADLTIGAGGTLNRESALLGTPTYTIFKERLAAVDAELIRLGLLRDARAPGTAPIFVKKRPGSRRVPEEQGEGILRTVVRTLSEAAA